MENIITEKFGVKEVKRYLDTRYYVSSCGDVFTSDYKGMGIIKKMSKAIDSYGYQLVTIYYSRRKIKVEKVHFLVARCFLNKEDHHVHVNHINGDKTDNRVENLEWCTVSENVKHAFDNGLKETRKGSDCNFSKLSEKEVLEIRAKYVPRKYTIYRLADEYKVTYQLISKIITRKCWAHI